MVSNKEIRPNSEDVPGIDVGCRCYTGSRHLVSFLLMRGHQLMHHSESKQQEYEASEALIWQLWSLSNGCSPLSAESHIYLISSRTGSRVYFFPTNSYAICVEQFCDVKFNQNQNQENHTKPASLSVLIWRKSVALYLNDIQWIYMLALFTYSAFYISLNVFSDCLKSCVHAIFNNVVVIHVSFFLD